ncbi:MAG TPA: hypothetical protein VNS09_14575 [Solirubrobacter sp.]|nr:hypothetical protein [Solirubrobacter sp.]
MSYDLEIGSHERPARELIERWASEHDLLVDDDLMISRPAARGDGHLFSVNGPVPAEPDDFAEDLAAACLAPRWMLTIEVPRPGPKRAIALARSLARTLAQETHGAAFDPQEDALIWPRGEPKRVQPRHKEEATSVVELAWFLPARRWPEAPAILLELLAHRCPEALPTRYGRFEPLPHRFDPAAPAALAHFMCDEREGDGFWLASRPSFGGFWRAPHDDPRITPGHEHLRIAQLQVEFDGRVLERDPRWREAVVELFATAATRLGAVFAAAQVGPHWLVSTNNRLWATAKTMRHGCEHIPFGGRWIGLPPVPMWLSWFGAPYRDLVASHLTEAALTARGMRRLLGRAQPPRIEDRTDGLLVRLGDEPRPRRSLGPWPLPDELTYRKHQAPRLDDPAPHIPPL